MFYTRQNVRSGGTLEHEASLRLMAMETLSSLSLSTHSSPARGVKRSAPACENGRAKKARGNHTSAETGLCYLLRLKSQSY